MRIHSKGRLISLIQPTTINPLPGAMITASIEQRVCGDAAGDGAMVDNGSMTFRASFGMSGIGRPSAWPCMQ